VVHSFHDPFVIAGQGRVMVEFVDQVAHLDTVLAPVSGGGLLSGLCLAAQALRPHTTISYPRMRPNLCSDRAVKGLHVAGIVAGPPVELRERARPG
jgi:threonine dehydratase